MPYKFETDNLKLSGLQDRRRKLTDEDKTEIKRLYDAGAGSWQALADRFHVSKKTIGLIVNPAFKERNDRHIKEHWRDYRPDNETRAAIVREHRHYKQQLYLAGELTENQKEES